MHQINTIDFSKLSFKNEGHELLHFGTGKYVDAVEHFFLFSMFIKLHYLTEDRHIYSPADFLNTHTKKVGKKVTGSKGERRIQQYLT